MAHCSADAGAGAGYQRNLWFSLHLFTSYLFSFSIRTLVAIQIASDWFEYQEKARSIQVYMSTFDAGIGQIRGELNRYDPQ
jgi:hypothetical protein